MSSDQNLGSHTGSKLSRSGGCYDVEGHSLVRAMDLLNPEARHFILGSLRRSTFLSSLCDCCKDVTIPFKIEKVLTIGKQVVTAQCCSIKVSGFMRSHFNEISLDGTMCDHEKSLDFLVLFSNLQWEVVARHYDFLIASGATFKSGYLEIPDMKGALKCFVEAFLDGPMVFGDW